jgi:hypothetical protein
VSVKMVVLLSAGGMRSLNSHNYGYWQSCIESYLMGQDLWEVVVGTEKTPPLNENTEAFKSGESRQARLCLC